MLGTFSVQIKLRPATNMCRPSRGGVGRRGMPRGGLRPTPHHHLLSVCRGKPSCVSCAFSHHCPAAQAD